MGNSETGAAAGAAHKRKRKGRASSGALPRGLDIRQPHSMVNRALFMSSIWAAFMSDECDALEGATQHSYTLVLIA